MGAKADRVKIWANAMNGEDFLCVHLDDFEEIEEILMEALDVIRCYASNDVVGDNIGEKTIRKIEQYLNL